MLQRNVSPWRAVLALILLLALAASACWATPGFDLSGFGPGVGVRARDGTAVGVLALGLGFDSDTKTLVDSWDAPGDLGKMLQVPAQFVVDKARFYLIAEALDVSAPSNVDDPRLYPGFGINALRTNDMAVEVGAYHAGDLGWTWLLKLDIVRLE